MYMVWPACPSPGIDPRMPTVSGWSGGLHTSIVAHSCVDVSSECLLVAVVAAEACGVERAA